jgi:transcription elongation factor Elf1
MSTFRFVCPVCGEASLSVQPYEVWPPPGDVVLRPPYEDQLGRPSYEVCGICGFEFGNDDNPGTAPPQSFDEYRAEWESRGRPAFS